MIRIWLLLLLYYNSTLLVKSIKNIDTSATNDDFEWYDRILNKFKCLFNSQGSLYLYHMRKAAGTTIHNIMNTANLRYVSREIYYTEGITLDNKLLNQQGLMTVTSFRHPIDRIISLYWYEHARFHYERDKSKIVTMNDWIDAWADGSNYKRNYILKNPTNVYVEVENYYTKVLSHWRGPEKVNLTHFHIAKANLKLFDIIMICEWMQSMSQWNAIHAAFPGNQFQQGIYSNKGDPYIKTILSSTCIINETSLNEKMIRLNTFDLLLFEYALKLSARRLLQIPELVARLKSSSSTSISTSTKLVDTCTIDINSNQTGSFQPKGHKGPRNHLRTNKL